MAVLLELSDEQKAGLGKVDAWLQRWQDYKRPEDQVFRLFGYAGTGKTSIAKAASETTALTPQFIAFTGKAAMVLKTKGCGEAATIHRTIYLPRGAAVKQYREELEQLEKTTDPGERRQLEAHLAEMKEALTSPSWVKRPVSDFRRDTFFIVDECSMPDKFLGEDLVSYGFPILALGDPAQLPPVMGAGYFTGNHKPDVLLTQIHRQVAGSPVLRLATAVRQGKKLPFGVLGDSRVVKKLTVAEYAEHDQVLCGTNKNRVKANLAIRQHLGRKKLMEPGDKLICLQNNYDVGVLNGSQWEVVNCEPWHNPRKEKPSVPKFYKARIKSLDEVGVEFTAIIHINPLLEGRPQFDKFWTPQLAGEDKALVMTYGYCVTCHKAQGSQWGSVAILDDWNNVASYQQWLYTAVTRAADRVTIVRAEAK